MLDNISAIFLLYGSSIIYLFQINPKPGVRQGHFSAKNLWANFYVFQKFLTKKTPRGYKQPLPYKHPNSIHKPPDKNLFLFINSDTFMIYTL